MTPIRSLKTFGDKYPATEGNTRIMEFSVENNIKEHFYGFKFPFLHHKTDTIKPSQPVK
jgi:hypothetical protein